MLIEFKVRYPTEINLHAYENRASRHNQHWADAESQ